MTRVWRLGSGVLCRRDPPAVGHGAVDFPDAMASQPLKKRGGVEGAFYLKHPIGVRFAPMANGAKTWTFFFLIAFREACQL